jgi:hypothetical protein
LGQPASQRLNRWRHRGAWLPERDMEQVFARGTRVAAETLLRLRWQRGNQRVVTLDWAGFGSPAR